MRPHRPYSETKTGCPGRHLPSQGAHSSYVMRKQVESIAGELAKNGTITTRRTPS